MAKLRSTLTDEQSDPQSTIVPDRVQKLIDLYKRNNFEYVLTQEDKEERTFEYRRTMKPQTYHYSIVSVYRVRDPYDRRKEYYFYQKSATVENDEGGVEPSGTYTYGFAIEPQSRIQVDPNTRKRVPTKVQDNPTYFFKWDSKEVRKLLDGSETPCQNFYVGYAGRKGQANVDCANPMAIHSVDDFIEGDFDDLVALSKSGKSDETPSLHLVKEARKQLDEKSIEKIRPHVQ